MASVPRMLKENKEIHRVNVDCSAA